MVTRAERKATPPKEAGPAEKPFKRIPLVGYRDILRVYGKNPDYEYRWMSDSHEGGQRIVSAFRAGWELVDTTQEDMGIGDNAVMRDTKYGSIYRIPADKSGKFLYLMRIKKEWHEADQAAKQAEVDLIDAELYRNTEKEQYRPKGGHGRMETGLAVQTMVSDED